MKDFSKTGNTKSFEILLERYRNALFGYLIQACPNRTIAEDVYQETYFRIIRSAGSYEKTAQYRTWLFTIARNLVIDHYRRKAGSETPFSALSGADETQDYPLVDNRNPNAQNHLEYDELRTCLQELITALPPDQKEIFLLRQESGLSFEETSRVAGCTVNTAKSRMRYALLKLREGLESKGLL